MRDWAKARFAQIAYDLFALLIPFSTFWPSGRWTVAGIDEIYVAPLFYLSDLALIGLLLTAFFCGLLVYGSLFRGSLFRGYQKDPAQVRFLWREYPLLIALLALCCLALLTTPFALNLSLAAYTTLRWCLAAAIALHLTFAPFDWQRFVKVFLLGLLIQALVGMGQVLLQRPLGLPGEMALPLSQPGAAVVAIAGQNWLRAYGLTFHPNVFGGYLVIALLLTMPFLLRISGWHLVWWLLWAGLIITFSRAAFLAAMITVPIAALWLYWQRPACRRSFGIAIAGLLLVGAGGAALFSEQLATRLGMGHVTEWLSLGEREAQLQVALGIISTRPVAGVGAGNFPLAVSQSAIDVSIEVRALPVHNVPLLLASEVGVLGGALWIWALIMALVLLFKWKERRNEWVVVGLCGWLALGIIALFDFYPWGLNAGRLLSATVVGLTGHAMLKNEPFNHESCHG
jgi:hypothetical protein